MKNKKNALNGSDLSENKSMLIKTTKNMKKVIYALILLAGCGKRTCIC